MILTYKSIVKFERLNEPLFYAIMARFHGGCDYEDAGVNLHLGVNVIAHRRYFVNQVSNVLIFP